MWRPGRGCGQVRVTRCCPARAVLYITRDALQDMARLTVLLLAVVICLLGTHLPPAASKPALLKPEESYTPEENAFIKIVDDLLNQLLRQLLQEYGKDTQPFSAEEESPYAVNSGQDKAKPQLPRPTRIPLGRPSRPAGAGEAGSSGGSNTHPGTKSANGGRIIFPSD